MTETTPHEQVAALYARYAPMVHRRVRRFFSANESPEIVQEVFVRVLERWSSFRGEASATTWLYRLTTNHCINRLRDASRRRELWREQGVALWGQSVQNAGQEARVLLNQLWEEIDPELVSIGVMYYVDGMSHAEIARVTDCSRRTVGNRLTQLQERIAETMAAEGEA